MSNYLSTPIQYQKMQSDQNIDLMAKIAVMQDQKYDASHSRIQAALDQFGMTRVLRKEDNDYIAAKLNGITTQLNSVGSNLANPSLTDSLVGKVKSAASDPIILNSMEQTAKFNNYQKELAVIREKKPELYNDLNNSFALNQAGYQDYMSGKTDKMGNLSYIPYTDVTKQALEKIKQLKDLRGEETIDTPEKDANGNPTGKQIKRSIKGLTQDEIFQYFPNVLSSEESRQLVIDGWGKYKDNMTQGQQEFNTYKTTKNSLLDEAIKQEEDIANNSVNSEEKRAASREKLKNLKVQKSTFNTITGEIDVNNPTQLGGFLHTQNFKNSIAEMAQSKWSNEYKSDEYYFDKANLDLAYQKNKRENLLAQKKLGALPGDGAVSIAQREGELPEELDPIGNLKKDYNNVYNDMTQTVTAAYNSDKTTPEMQKEFKVQMNRMGYDEHGAVIDANKAKDNSRASAMKVAFTESGMNYVHGDIAKKLSGLETKRTTLANEFGTVAKQSLIETFKKDPDKYVSDIFLKMGSIAGTGKYSDDIKKAEDFYYNLTGKRLSTYQKLDVTSQFSESILGFIAPKSVQEEIKNALLKNPEKLQMLDRYMEKDPNNPSKVYATGILAGDDSATALLVSDSKKLANEKMSQKTKEGRNVYFNTSQIATVGDKAVREKWINMIPQTEDTSLFNKDNPISYYKNPDGSLTLVQNSGYTNSTKGAVSKQDAKIVVDKEDALYSEMLKYVDLTESGRGVDAQRTTVEVKPYRTPAYMDSNNESTLSKVDGQLTKLSPNVLKNLFTQYPDNYLTKERTLDVYKRVLKNKVPEQEIETFVNSLSNNINTLKVKVVPFDGQWDIELAKPNGDKIVKGGLGMKYLEDDVSYLVETYPQTLISDWILRRLVKNPSEINTILK